MLGIKPIMNQRLRKVVTRVATGVAILAFALAVVVPVIAFVKSQMHNPVPEAELPGVWISDFSQAERSVRVAISPGVVSLIKDSTGLKKVIAERVKSGVVIEVVVCDSDQVGSGAAMSEFVQWIRALPGSGSLSVYLTSERLPASFYVIDDRLVFVSSNTQKAHGRSSDSPISARILMKRFGALRDKKDTRCVCCKQSLLTATAGVP